MLHQARPVAGAIEPMHSKNDAKFLEDVLCDGYLRTQETFISNGIPFPIKEMIELFGSQLKILGIGGNKNGQFGLGGPYYAVALMRGIDFHDSYTVNKWRRMQRIEKIASHHGTIFCNFNSIFIIDPHYRVYAAGCNQPQHLGEFPVMCHEFKRVKVEEPIAFVSTGKMNSRNMFLHGVNGELIQCHLELPHVWITDEKIVDIKCGDSHSVFLTQNGNVFINDRDEMKMIEIDAFIKQIAVGCRERTVMLDINGKLHEEGWDKIDMNLIKTPIKKITHGMHHVLCLGEDGSVIGFGWQSTAIASLGQIGQHRDNNGICQPQIIQVFENDDRDSIIDIDCGELHNMLLSKEFKVITFGSNTCKLCSAEIQEDVVAAPYLIDQKREMGLQNGEHVYAIKAGSFDSIVFVRSRTL